MTERNMGAAVLPELTFGVSAGDLIDVVGREIQLTLRQAKGNRLDATKIGLQRMFAIGLITESDLERVSKACDIVFAADNASYDQTKAASELDALYLDMLASGDSSEIAITMVGVAYSNKQDQTMAVSGLFGMVVGGLIGSAIPGLGSAGGALIGGLIGGWLGARCPEVD
ncbi:MAG: hypothetical protein IH872_09730 [Chloroflexi bacterium]|nr:hypothetical protein [Chloroflexota bacterium]